MGVLLSFITVRGSCILSIILHSSLDFGRR
jgi:hypothetical protein